MFLDVIQYISDLLVEVFLYDLQILAEQTVHAQTRLSADASIGNSVWSVFKSSFLIGITSLLAFIAFVGSIRIRQLPYFYYGVYLLCVVLFILNHHHFLFSDFFTQEINGYELWYLIDKVWFSTASVAYLLYILGIINKRDEVSDFRKGIVYSVIIVELSTCVLASFLFFVYHDVPLGIMIRNSFTFIPLVFLPYALFPYFRSGNPVIVLVLIGAVLLALSASVNLILTVLSIELWIFDPIDFLQLGVILELLFFAMGVGLRIDSREIEDTQKRELLLSELEAKDKQNIDLTSRLANLVREQSGMIEEETAKKLQAEYQERLTELEMRALRSQMNPHFLFNCLNSLKRLILEKDKDGSEEYINKFAVLLKTILDNSRKKTIDLQSEIDFIQLYLELENLRFKKQFDFKISSDPDVETENVLVPPMLLQPYVENAIWHGLMHKLEGQRRLEIFISNKGSEIEVSIRDNGVGRRMGTQIKNAQKSRTKSLGGQITAERLELINSLQEGKEVSAKIVDLFDHNSNPIGTEVIVSLAL